MVGYSLETTFTRKIENPKYAYILSVFSTFLQKSSFSFKGIYK